MKKLKFDTLFESLMMSEGTISKQERYGNMQYNIPVIMDKLGDSESESYNELVNAFVERWKGQKYLGNLTSDQIVSMLDEVLTNIGEMNEDGIETISYSDLNLIIENITRERFKGHGQGLSVLAKRWSSKVQSFFEKIKDAHVQEVSDESSLDDDILSNSESDIPSLGTNKGVENNVLSVVQASDGMSREEIVSFLTGRMGREERSANNIVDSLISSGDLTQDESGNYIVSRETKPIETLATKPDDDLDIETDIPFNDDDLSGEDEDVDAALRDAIESDPYKTRDY